MQETLITDDDLEFIDAILEKYASQNSIFNVSELDGFLTALVSGPDVILPSEWIPAIWGGEEHTPKWTSEKELSRFFDIVIGLMNSIVELLTEDPESYEALFLEDQEGKEIVAIWCCGFMRGVALRHERWQEMPEYLQEQVGIISLFCMDEGAEVLEQLSAEEVAEVEASIEPSVRTLHTYWSEYGRNEAPQFQPYVAEPKTGRNAPCPCGSGKKYKKCCMDN